MRWLMRWLIVPVLVSLSFAAQVTKTADKTVSYSHDIAPLLTIKCGNCHGLIAYPKFDKIQGNLDVTTYEGLLRGGGRGRAVTPGDPEHSLILSDLSQFSKDMYSKHPTFSDENRLLVRQWITQGAKQDPDAEGEFRLACENLDLKTTYGSSLSYTVYVRTLDEAYIQLTSTDAVSNKRLETRSFSADWDSLYGSRGPGRFQPLYLHDDNPNKWPQKINVTVSTKYAKNPFGAFVFCGDFNNPWGGVPADMIGIDPFVVSPEDDSAALTYWLDDAADVTITILPYDSQQPVYARERKGVPAGLHRERWNLTDLKNVGVSDGDYLVRLTIATTSREYTAKSTAVGLFGVR